MKLMDIEKIPTQSKKIIGAIDSITKLKDKEDSSGEKQDLDLGGIAKKLARRNATKKSK